MPRDDDFEIMAPAGSWDCLSAALEAGADSVYFGVGRLNMRAHSSANFTEEDLPEVTRVCREAGVKAYLAVNTVMYDDDLPDMRRLVDSARQAGVDAVIASDAAVMRYAASRGVEVHLSTQLNISNREALRFYAQYADVAVLARELNLDQVAGMHEAILTEPVTGPGGKPVRIEMFCHGALCMAISGKCYLSLHEYDRSANRGSCMQVCRRAYTVRDQSSDLELTVDNHYIMSPKDLCTIGFLDRLAGAGVRVFKIEGRARGPEYVKTVVGCYREALDSYLAGKFDAARVPEWEKRLATVFNRGFWNGYYLGQRLGEWTRAYGSQATLRKEYAGIVTNFFKKIEVAEITVHSGFLNEGDHLLVTGNTTGAYDFTLQGMRLDDDHPVLRVEKGTAFAVRPGRELRRGDKVFKLVQA